MTRFIIAGSLLSLSVGVGFIILRRPIREILEEVSFEKARKSFRQYRERLEARFITILGTRDPDERARWEDAHWENEVVWARDRRTRRLTALVAVRFPEHPFSDEPNQIATALFEFQGSIWETEGNWLDAMPPEEAIALNRRLEPVIQHHRSRGLDSGETTSF